jgi:tetratricopeptide (TPR) repeat protein
LTPRSARLLAFAAGLVAGLALSPRAHAQDIAPEGNQDATAPRGLLAPAEPESTEPELAQGVRTLLDQGFLSAQERRDLRILHGVWTIDDLDTPARRARAALRAGVLDDASLRAPSAAPEDRAEAALLAGEFARALEELGDAPSFRAQRLRALSLRGMGKVDECVAVLDALAARLAGATPEASELAEAVRALSLRARMKGQESTGGRDFKALMALLAQARTGAGAFSPDVRLAEAELLYEKDNFAEAGATLGEALSLNPRDARAYALLGQMAVDGLDLDKAEAIAARLDELRTTITTTQAAPSVLASHVRVSAALRLNDPDAAEAALAPALAVFPEHAIVREAQMGILAARFDSAAIDAALASRDQAHGGRLADAHLHVGRVLSERRQYELASRYLEQAAAREPLWAAPWTELGLLEVQAGRDDRASAALKKATALDPFNVRAANSLKLVTELGTYATFESEHFIVRCKPGRDEILAREMLPVLERLHARVTGNAPGGIDFVPPQKTMIQVLPDHRWFSVRITGMPSVHTFAASTGPVIAMESPALEPGTLVGTYDWPRVLQHEYAHTVTLARTNNRIAHWFTEAAAVYLEDSPVDFSRAQLLTRAVMSNELLGPDEINLAFARPKKPTDRALAYAQGWWMYSFIVERWGPRAPLEIMDRYAKGQREREAMREVLGLERDAFFAEFQAWALGQLRAWGMVPAEGVPRVKELFLRDKVEPGPDEPTPERVAAWLKEFPDHPDLLALDLDERLKALPESGPAPEELARELAPVLERAMRVRTLDPLPRRVLARLALDRGEVARAAEHLEWLDAREQHSPVFAAELARVYAREGAMDRASDKAARAVRIAPFDGTLRELAATIAVQRRQWDLAEAHLKALIRLEPDQPLHTRRLEALNALRNK